ncbi:hypothetical protein TIFTF001_037558 [Ficus carica]|uniref:Sieve element occlusion N-terminal domain-containing protein n=1 Tax=Ficus carica TaxID=3494 RepID=A0AA88E8Z3_FICCA|nr:hypothetical protein TIFTF001_037558 [Ficus carica]
MVVIAEKLQPTDVKFNPFKVTDVNEITSQLLSTRIYVGEHQKFDYSSLFVIVQNILKGSTRIVNEIAQGGQQQYLETAGQEITPTLTNADFVVPSCKLKEILSKVPALMIMLCKKGGGPEIAHERTKSIFTLVSTYKLNAMAVLTLAAFAVKFGEFWLLASNYQSAAHDQELAKSLATLKRVPAFTRPSSLLQKSQQTTVQFKPISELLINIMKFIETMLKVEELAATYDPIGLSKDLTPYDDKICEILKEQNKWLNNLKQKKDKADRYDAILKIFEHETNIAEVNEIDAVLKKMERVFLFISDLTISAEYYQFHLEQIQKKIEGKLPRRREVAVQGIAHFGCDELERKVETYNAFQYINAAGMAAYLFDESSVKKKLITHEWLHNLIDGRGTTTATVK